MIKLVAQFVIFGVNVENRDKVSKNCRFEEALQASNSRYIEFKSRVSYTKFRYDKWRSGEKSYQHFSCCANFLPFDILRRGARSFYAYTYYGEASHTLIYARIQYNDYTYVEYVMSMSDFFSCLVKYCPLSLSLFPLLNIVYNITASSYSYIFTCHNC